MGNGKVVDVAEKGSGERAIGRQRNKGNNCWDVLCERSVHTKTQNKKHTTMSKNEFRL